MKIFLSHSSVDKPLLREIKRFLAPGLETWLDERELNWGSDLKSCLEEAIDNCDLFVIFVSKAALESDYVIKELERATVKEKELHSIFILPILMPCASSHFFPETINTRLFLNLPDREESSVRSLAEKINHKILKLLLEKQNKISHISSSPSIASGNLHNIIKYTDCEFIENIKNSNIKSQLHRILDDASKLIYYIVGAPQVYQHDSKLIEGMEAGDIYRATHPFNSNKKAHYMQSSQFKAYIQTQIRATNRKVNIKRLYILPGDSISNLDVMERQHLHNISAQEGIESKITYLDSIPDNNFGQDFVVFDNSLLGVAIPKFGEMLGSEYHYSVNDNCRILEDYKLYFDTLFDAAIPLQDSLRQTDSIYRIDNSVLLPQKLDVRRPAFVLQTPASINGKETQRLMIVLRTAGCSYDINNMGCSMCDFKRHAMSKQEVNNDVLMQQLEYSLNQAIFGLNDVSQIDLLTLGSFLHDNEVSEEFRLSAFEKFSTISGLKKIVIESRSPYIQQTRLSDIKSLLRYDQILEIGLGVETSNEPLRNQVLKKNLSDAEIRRVISVCANTDIEFLAYILIGSMTLTEDEAVEDAIISANYIADLCNSRGVKFRIAYEPVFITHGTKLEEMYMQGEYILINLWRVIEVIRATNHLGTIFIGLSDEGLSSNRIPQGCVRCTNDIKEAIERFNGTQLISEFDLLHCDCRL